MKFGFMGALAFSAALVFGCSGNNESGDDDADDGAGLTGGTSGVGGTATGGTAAGGTATGGTSGSGSSSCTSLCEEAQACPGAAPLDCAQGCTDEAAEAAAFGCSEELRIFYACLSGIVDLCSLNLQITCTRQNEALIRCSSGIPSGECTEGGTPVNATCTSLCQRTLVCTGEAIDCATECATFAAEVAATGCADEYQDYTDCASTCTNICSLSQFDCPTTYPAYVDCIASFCTANPTTPPCGP